METLCKIFSKRQEHKFLSTYLELFYKSLMKGLSQDFGCLSSIIENSGRLFEMELDGLRITLPYFIKQLYHIIPVTQIPSGYKANVDNLKLAAYKLIGSMMFHISHFGTLFQDPLVIEDQPHIDQKISKYTKKSFQTENNLVNLSHYSRNMS